MCGSFSCSKNSLIGLNIFYIVGLHFIIAFNPLIIISFFQFVAFLLIGVAATAKNSNQLTSLPIVGGIIACGIFLLFIAIVGLFGAIKHHQVMLFLYMVVLFAIFVIQFSVACACLAANPEDELNAARSVRKSAISCP